MDSTRDQGLVLMAMKLDRGGLKYTTTYLLKNCLSYLTVHRENYFIQIYIGDLDKYYRVHMARTLGNTFCTTFLQFFNICKNQMTKWKFRWNLGFRNNRNKFLKMNSSPDQMAAGTLINSDETFRMNHLSLQDPCAQNESVFPI